MNSFTNAEDAVDLLRSDESLDLLVTDHSLPDMMGDELAALSRKLRPEMPVLMLTSLARNMMDEGEHPQSVNLVVSKPINAKRLVQAFRLCLSSTRKDRATIKLEPDELEGL